MSVIDVPSLLRLCGKPVPPQLLPSWTVWVDTLTPHEAWIFTGLLDRHFPGLSSPGTGHGPDALRALLRGIDEEIRAWKRQPKEILVYTLASRFVVNLGSPQGINWGWQREHEQAWRFFWPHTRTEQPPRGPRVVCVLGKDLPAVLDAYLEQGVKEILDLIHDPMAIVDCVNTIDTVAKIFDANVERVLPEVAFDAYYRLLKQRDHSPLSINKSYTHLAHLAERLPPILQEKHQNTLERLRQRLKQWAVMEPPNKEANEHLSQLLESLPPQLRREFRSDLNALEDDLQTRFQTVTNTSEQNFPWIYGNEEHFLHNWD